MTEKTNKKSKYPLLFLILILVQLGVIIPMFLENGKLMSWGISWGAFIVGWIMFIVMLLAVVWYVFFFHEDEKEGK